MVLIFWEKTLNPHHAHVKSLQNMTLVNFADMMTFTVANDVISRWEFVTFINSFSQLLLSNIWQPFPLPNKLFKTGQSWFWYENLFSRKLKLLQSKAESSENISQETTWKSLTQGWAYHLLSGSGVSLSRYLCLIVWEATMTSLSPHLSVTSSSDNRTTPLLSRIYKQDYISIYQQINTVCIKTIIRILANDINMSNRFQ